MTHRIYILWKIMKYAIIFVLKNMYKYAYVCYHRIYAEICSHLLASFYYYNTRLFVIEIPTDSTYYRNTWPKPFVKLGKVFACLLVFLKTLPQLVYLKLSTCHGKYCWPYHRLFRYTRLKTGVLNWLITK